MAEIRFLFKCQDGLSLFSTVQGAREGSGLNNELPWGGGGCGDWEMFVHDSASCVFKNVFKYPFCILILKTVRIPNHCGLNLAGI